MICGTHTLRRLAGCLVALSLMLHVGVVDARAAMGLGMRPGVMVMGGNPAPLAAGVAKAANCPKLNRGHARMQAGVCPCCAMLAHIVLPDMTVILPDRRLAAVALAWVPESFLINPPPLPAFPPPRSRLV